jgi:Glyoxalase-like domain
MSSLSKSFEIDHVFVLVSVDAPEADRLVELGFLEGSRNTHPGQGTANRRFFFKNAMLEFLWVADPGEAQKPPACDLHLWDRWVARETGASPFGICLRPVSQNIEHSAPFAHWLYQPSYSPAAIPVASNSSVVVEPLLFCLPVHRRPDGAPIRQREPLNHPNGVSELTIVRLLAPSESLASGEIQAVRGVAGLQFQRFPHHLLELTFDGCSEQVIDCRPGMPLLLQW